MADLHKWEYRVQTLSGTWGSPKDDVLESFMNEWGEEGWEVVSFQPLPSSGKVRLVAKRLLTDRSRRQRSMPTLES